MRFRIVPKKKEIKFSILFYSSINPLPDDVGIAPIQFFDTSADMITNVETCLYY